MWVAQAAEAEAFGLLEGRAVHALPETPTRLLA